MSFLLENIQKHAASRPDVVVLEGMGGESLSWQDLPQAIKSWQQRLSGTLADGQRPVAVQADQGVEHCVADLALMEAAIPVLSLPSFISAGQRAHAISDSGAQALVRDGSSGLAVEALHAPARVELPVGTSRVSYTSGSSGTPKGVCLSAAHLLTVARAVVQMVGEEHVGRHLAVLPPGLLLENVAGLYATLLAGGTYIVLPQAQVGLSNPFVPDFRTMAWTIASTRATSIILAPEYLSGLTEWLERSGQRLPRLTLVAVGGARVSPQLLERAARMGLPVRQGYGLTECGSVVCLHDGTNTGIGSVGRPVGAHRVRIADDGEILLDGPCHLGTIGAPIDTTTMRTGDLGRFDSDGNLWIEGRKSNLIITSFGRNISPEWIEALLCEQHSITQALVYGECAPQLSALIVARDTQAAVLDGIAAVNGQLPEYARLGEWQLVAPFTPVNGLLTGNGRMRRAEIMRHHVAAEINNAVL